MNKKFKIVSVMLIFSMMMTLVPTVFAAQSNEVAIVLSDDSISVDGTEISSSDEKAVYVSHDIIYYEDRDTYDSGNPYGEGSEDERHSSEEAAAHSVVNITEPGTYRISGTLSKGQIAVDLGKDSVSDPEAVVSLILDNADITCTVAPAIIFYNVYECNTDWTAYDNGELEEYEASSEVDTSDAGANLIIADGSVNNITGSHVARIYDDDANSGKKYKFDGALYSKRSMNIDGEEKGDGVVNLVADNEGLGSEMHLTLNGGKFNIYSNDDGVNVNEDGVSVFTINGGSLHILAGLDAEGDGVDSNGYLVINGGTVIALARPQADSGLDSDMGSFINGGYVVATGSTMDWAESDSNQVTMNLQFAQSQSSDEAIIVTDTSGSVIFAYDPDKDETAGSRNRGYQGAVISCPEFKQGDTYNVYIGGDVEGTEVDGLYDASTVTSFDGATRQQYTGNDVRGGFGGGFDRQGGFRQEGFVKEDFEKEGLERGAFGRGNFAPDNFNRANMPMRPDRGEISAASDGQWQQKGGRGEFTPGVEGEPPHPESPGPGEGTVTAPQADAKTAAQASCDFYMNDKVNAFSGVTDEGTDTSGNIIGGADAPTDITVTDKNGKGRLPFADVTQDDWYYGSVDKVYSNSIFKGVTDERFSPDGHMTRAMLWTVIARLSGMQDSEGDSWYSAARDYVTSDGVSDGSDPDSAITKEQLVTMLWRKYGEAESYADLSLFEDCDDVSDYASKAVKWAVETGILSGNDQGMLECKKIATRAEVAKIIETVMNLK